MRPRHFNNLRGLAKNICDKLDGSKKYCIIFAHNGTGKTRLSGAFENYVKKIDEATSAKIEGSLYYNAFTEDLFYWNNDIENDSNMRLMFNKSSSFFGGLDGLDIENKIRELLQRYDNYSFSINFEEGYITFSRIVKNVRGLDELKENIKISRGEESIFVWCFFLAVVDLAIGGIPEYSWVRYIYIDDPISSLDDNNVVAVACHLAQTIKAGEIKTIISTHHALFFNVICNELRKSESDIRYFGFNKKNDKHFTRNMNDTPFFHHVALLKELKKAVDSEKLYTYHFNILRNLFEKTAAFHGFDNFYDCISLGETSEEEGLYNRMINLMSHGGHSIFEPREMVDDNKQLFKEILDKFLNQYNFNEALLLNDEEGDNND